ERVLSDAILRIKPRFAHLIASREKNHEYRKYRLHDTTVRLWLYEIEPTCAITYVIRTSRPKLPGQVRDPSGVGNDDFDAGKKVSTHGYPILGLWKLKNPLTPEAWYERFKIPMPEGHCYAPRILVECENIEDMEEIF
ncbi:hypothetical protein FISHEDRAFT_14318, partial [Fistulina hepatica ATCC 64428]